MNGYTVMRYGGLAAVGFGLGLMDPAMWVVVGVIVIALAFVYGVLDQ